MLRASVTIATWNRRARLEQLVEALADQTLQASEYEVIVCDSNSTDGTGDAIRSLALRYKNLRYLNVDQNVLAVKRNEGIRAAKANIVIFMDDDVIPDARFVESHVNAQEADDGIVCCGQIRYPEEWTSRSNYFRYRDSRHLGSTRPDVVSDQLPPWMITVMNLSFKQSELIPRVGFVSEEFRRYGGEDAELGFRVVEAGMRLVFLPGALVIHYEHKGSIEQYYRKLYVNSRDSAPILYEHIPAALHATKVHYIERLFVDNGTCAKLLRQVARLGTHPRAVRLLIKYLEKTDDINLAYCPFAYRYLTVAAVAAGIRDRAWPASPSQANVWFA